MAQGTTYSFGKQALLIGDGGGPEQFTAPCGVTQLTATLNIESETTNIPDCSDPDLASWLAVDETSRQLVIAGSGVFTKEAYNAHWQAWWLNGGKKNVRWVRTLTAPNQGYFQGPALLTQYEDQGSKGTRWQHSFQITFDGKPTYTTF